MENTNNKTTSTTPNTAGGKTQSDCGARPDRVEKANPKKPEIKLPKVETSLNRIDCLNGMLFLSTLKVNEDSKKIIAMMYDELMSIHNQLK